MNLYNNVLEGKTYDFAFSFFDLFPFYKIGKFYIFITFYSGLTYYVRVIDRLTSSHIPLKVSGLNINEYRHSLYVLNLRKSPTTVTFSLEG